MKQVTGSYSGGKFVLGKYVIQARFTGQVPYGLSAWLEEGVAYLDDLGRWAVLDDALGFGSRAAAQKALEDKWYRLRNEGVRSVVLSVVPSPLKTSC